MAIWKGNKQPQESGTYYITVVANCSLQVMGWSSKSMGTLRECHFALSNFDPSSSNQPLQRFEQKSFVWKVGSLVVLAHLWLLPPERFATFGLVGGTRKLGVFGGWGCHRERWAKCEVEQLRKKSSFSGAMWEFRGVERFRWWFIVGLDLDPKVEILENRNIPGSPSRPNLHRSS